MSPCPRAQGWKVELSAVLHVRREHHGPPARLDSVDEHAVRVVHGEGLDLEGAHVEGGRGLHVAEGQLCLEGVEAYREGGRTHLGVEGLAESLPIQPCAHQVDPAGGDVEWREERHALDVVPVDVREEHRRLCRPAERATQRRQSGAAIEHEPMPLVQQLYAAGVATDPRDLGSADGHASSHSPEHDLHVHLLPSTKQGP